MKSGYKIYWSDNALKELQDTYEYIETFWTEKELRKLSLEIEKTLALISKKPRLFPLSESINVRKVVIKKLNTMYYRKSANNEIEIISFFSNRQNSNKIVK